MSAHNADRSSKRSSGGPHLGFRGMKVTSLLTFTANLSQLSHTTAVLLLVSGIVTAMGISPNCFEQICQETIRLYSYFTQRFTCCCCCFCAMVAGCREFNKGHSYRRAFPPKFSIFVSRNFSIFHIFLVYFPQILEEVFLLTNFQPVPGS